MQGLFAQKALVLRMLRVREGLYAYAAAWLH